LLCGDVPASVKNFDETPRAVQENCKKGLICHARWLACNLLTVSMLTTFGGHGARPKGFKGCGKPKDLQWSQTNFVGQR
jgi:hypothetical protein